MSAERAARASFLLVLGLGAEARAGEIGGVAIDVTSTSNAAWRSELEYGEFFERLNVSTGTGAWHLGVRLDTATFFSSPAADVASRYALEKVTASWTGRVWDVTAGDAYVSFGRGLSLSLRKVDELGVDTTLRGVRAVVDSGDLSGTVAAGFANPQNTDEASGKSIDDPYDLIAGAQVEATAWEGATFGLHGSAIAFHDGVGLVPRERWADRFFQLGPFVDAPSLTEWLGVYLEGIGQVRETGSASDEALGVGLYGSATAYFGPATILFEGKAYGHLEPVAPNFRSPEFASVTYNNPPTVERVLQIVENPQRETAGGRVRFEWTASPGDLALVNYGLFRDWLGYDDPVSIGSVRPATVHDPYVGLETRWGDGHSFASVTMGVRAVVVDGSGSMVRRDAHFEANADQSLGGPWSLNMHALHVERKKHESPILDQRFREGSVLLGLRFRPHLTVSGGYDYTTEPTQPKTHYPNGSVEWNITSSSSLRLMGGSIRGGLRCASGICRVFPPFEGAKVVATLRF